MKKNIEKFGDVSMFEDFVRFYLTNGPRFWYDPDFDSSYLWEGLSYYQEAIQHIFTNVFNGFNVTRQLCDIKCPVLLISCLYDFVCPPSLWDSYRDQFQKFTYHLFVDCGHNPMVEKPEKFKVNVK